MAETEIKPDMFVQSKHEIISYEDELYVRITAYFPKWLHYNESGESGRSIYGSEIDSESEKYQQLENHYQNGEVIR